MPKSQGSKPRKLPIVDHVQLVDGRDIEHARGTLAAQRLEVDRGRWVTSRPATAGAVVDANPNGMTSSEVAKHLKLTARAVEIVVAKAKRRARELGIEIDEFEELAHPAGNGPL